MHLHLSTYLNSTAPFRPLLGALILFGLPGLHSCVTAPAIVATAEGDEIRVEYDSRLHSRIVSELGARATVIGDFGPSEYLSTSLGNQTDFQFISRSDEQSQDEIGGGRKTVVLGRNDAFEKQLTLTTYEEFPEFLLLKVRYKNVSASEIRVDSWTNNHYQITADANSGEAAPRFWSFQGASYEARPDWVLPLKVGFSQDNFMGMNATDYGGGTPVSDIWRRDVGVAVGHLETVPKEVSLPVTMPEETRAFVSINSAVNRTLAPGESLETLLTFVAVHRGDYFKPLSRYRQLMARRGVVFPEVAPSAYDPVWCAWGYERNFNVDQVTGTLPKVKELGFKWAVLDDGWQTAEGDWYLNPAKFPGGDKDMKTLTSKIRAAGLRPKLWWAPLAVDPGTELLAQHPDFLLLNKAGETQDISWWDAYYLCPAYPPVREYTRSLVRKFMGEWGYDGLKIDGQHLNGAPPCFNPAHQHERPEESVEAVPTFFRNIFETAAELTPDAVVEICPCGTSYSFFTLPFTNQPVASDPLSSWQIRLKGKTMKALMGPRAPYYGDHVELSDGGSDFASTVGIGGIVGSKFTWPLGVARKADYDLTGDREQLLSKWLRIYLSHMLPTGEYLGDLYDIGFDRPEAHAIRKDSSLYYAFFAENWEGNVELRGLGEIPYVVRDYENDSELGQVRGPVAALAVTFKGHLLLEATPDD